MNLNITLLSDWRLRDPYVAMLKGRLMSAFPHANIVDITHYVDKFNLLQTALLMKNSYRSFPDGSIHLMLTNMSLNDSFSPVMLENDGHYFIGEDNGIFHLMFGQEILLKGFQLTDNKENTLGQILQLIQSVNEGTISTSTSEYLKFKRMFTEQPEHSIQEKHIEGQIVYIDAFNNAVTNITSKMFDENVKGKRFTATIQSKGSWTVQKYYEQYHDSYDEMYLCTNALGLIEVSLFRSDVAVLADLEPGDKITISYE